MRLFLRGFSNRKLHEPYSILVIANYMRLIAYGPNI
jgi:hypothetical protein